MLCSKSLSSALGRTAGEGLTCKEAKGYCVGFVSPKQGDWIKRRIGAQTLRIIGCVCCGVCWCAGRGGGLPPPFLAIGIMINLSA